MGASVVAVMVAACGSSGSASSPSASSPGSSASSSGSSASASSPSSGSSSGSASSGSTSGSGSSSGTSGSSSGKNVTITYWSSSKQEQIDYLDSHFNDSHPGITVKGQYIASADNTTAKVVAALKSGTEPNILLGQDPSNLPLYAQSGKVVDLSTALKAETDALYPGIRSGLFYQGKQLGFALGGVGDYLLFYNKDDFAKAGITDPPKTWDELVADAKTLTEKLSKPGKPHYGFYVPLGSAEWISYVWESLLWGNGGSLLNSDGTKVAFNDKAGVDALNAWYTMVQKDHSAPTTSYAQGGSYDGAPAFASGAVSMIVNGQWALSEFKDINYGVALMPAGTSGKSSAGIGIGVATVFNTGGDDAVKAAEEFVKWLGQPEQGAYLTAQSGGLPSAPNQLDQETLKKSIAGQPTYQTFAEQLKYGQVRPTIPSYAAISQALSDNINKALTGKLTPQQALDAAAEAGNAAIANSGS
jgi:ABC-type glycerol-3-phosphate transport system substrate-binding protein